MICEKCNKEFKYESAYNKHIAKCDGTTKKISSPKTEIANPKDVIAKKIEDQYDTLLSLIALSLVRISAKDARIIYENKDQAAKAMGVYGADHVWILTALDKVTSSLSITGVIMAHAPIIMGILENHKPAPLHEKPQETVNYGTA